MSRGMRAAVGSVVAFVLLLVAGVAALVAVVGTDQLGDRDRFFGTSPEVAGGPFADPVTVQAEVLDVDGEIGPDHGWASADVTFTTESGDVVVTTVDLGERRETGAPLPEVGDTVEVVYERGEPEFAMRSAEVDAAGAPRATPDDGRLEAEYEAEQDAIRLAVTRSSRLAVGAGVLLLLVVAGTAVAVARAPRPEPPAWADGVSEGPAAVPPRLPARG